MSLFGPPKFAPRQWSDFSLDGKLFYSFEVALMVLWLASWTGRLSLLQELEVYGSTLLIAITISAIARLKQHWHWPGTDIKGTVSAFGGILLGVACLWAATPLFSPYDPKVLPWYLSAVNIIGFNLLGALNLTSLSKEVLLRREDKGSSAEEPAWKPVVRAVLSIGFIVVFLSSVAFFYFFGVAYKHGSPYPTKTHSVPLENHGVTLYITPKEHAQIVPLERISMIGFPSFLITILLLDVLLKKNLLIPSRPKS